MEEKEGWKIGEAWSSFGGNAIVAQDSILV